MMMFAEIECIYTTEAKNYPPYEKYRPARKSLSTKKEQIKRQM
jgi:hypothetical protein